MDERFDAMSNKELALSRKTAGAALKTAKFLATVEGLDALNEDEFSTAKDSTRPPPMHYFDHLTTLLVNRLRSLSQLCPTTALRRYLSFAPVASLIGEFVGVRTRAKSSTAGVSLTKATSTPFLSIHSVRRSKREPSGAVRLMARRSGSATLRATITIATTRLGALCHI